jgi:hypothetical protein
MLNIKSKWLVSAGLVALALGSGEAARKTRFKLEKVIIINECGSGGWAHSNQISYTSNYYNTVLGPKYGFKCTIPATQAAIKTLFNDDSLATYDAIVFNGGTRVGGSGAVGDTSAQHAFERWMRHGGGLLGIHGLLDHNGTWPWLRDSLMSGAVFTVHSNWGSDPNAQVQWDTLKTNGVYRALKPEYDSMRACFPPLHNHFTFPDEWYSVSVNPRTDTVGPYSADVIMTIDEGTYNVPGGGAMGLGHPVMWTHKVRPDADSNVGRFVYFSRGHDQGAWDGTSSNHAPISPAAINGVVYSDTSKNLMTKGWLWQGLRYAAGLHLNTVPIVRATNASFGGILQAKIRNGILNVQVTNSGKHEVNVYTLSGRNVARSLGNGDAQYSFSNLKSGSLYIVQVKASGKSYTQRVLL